MAEDNRTVDQRYIDQTKGQQDKLADAHTSGTKRYGDLRKASDAAYEAMKTEARINKALSDLAGGPASSSMTHRQRSESALRNEIGDTGRQQQDYSKEIDLALKNLDAQNAADQVYITAINNALRNADKLQRNQFDAELGIKQKYHELAKKNSTFDQVYKLYSSRRIDKNAFKDATGIAVKAIPAPRRVVTKPKTVIKLGNERPQQVKNGYELHYEYDHATHQFTYYEVKQDAAKEMKDKNISLFENGRMKGDGQIHADLHYEGFAQADAAGKQRILAVNSKDFKANFGEGYYNLYDNFYANMSGAGQYYRDEDKARLQELLANPEYYAGQHTGGWDSFTTAYDTAWNNANVNVAARAAEQQKLAGQGGQVRWSVFKETVPEIAAAFQYDGSTTDLENEQYDLPPRYFDMDKAAKMMDLPDGYQLPEKWDEQSIIELLNTYLDKRAIQTEGAFPYVGDAGETDIAEQSAPTFWDILANRFPDIDPNVAQAILETTQNDKMCRATPRLLKAFIAKLRRTSLRRLNRIT
jgi:hypothetical protein